MPHNTNAALTQLRAWLAQGELGDDKRLPPERELCVLLGVSRGELRKALAVLENEGALWRQVGKGTFVGVRPSDDIASLTAVADRSSPADVMRARRRFEPVLAAEAAVHASAADLKQLELCIAGARNAHTWREYETCDNEFHRTVARGAGSELLLAMFDQMNAVRRAVVWTRGRARGDGPPADHHSFAEHDRIYAAIAERDPRAAHAAMLRHLASVEAQLLPRQEAAE